MNACPAVRPTVCPAGTTHGTTAGRPAGTCWVQNQNQNQNQTVVKAAFGSPLVTLSIHRYGLYRAGADKRMGRSAAVVGGGF